MRWYASIKPLLHLPGFSGYPVWRRLVLAEVKKVLRVPSFVDFSNSPSSTKNNLLRATMQVEIRGSEYTENFRIFFKNDEGRYISPMHDIPLFANVEKNILNMVVEIPRWTNAKMEIATKDPLNPIKQDSKNGKLRFVHNCFPHHGYIWNYGALPQTWENPHVTDPHTGAKGDNDPLDVVEIGSRVAKRGEVIEVKVIGILAMLDDGETDWKVIAIDVRDPVAEQINDMKDLERLMPGYFSATVEWFRIYKMPAGSPPNEFAFDGDAKDQTFALRIIEETHNEWKKLMNGTTNKGKLELTCTSSDAGGVKVDDDAAVGIVSAFGPAEGKGEIPEEGEAFTELQVKMADTNAKMALANHQTENLRRVVQRSVLTDNEMENLPVDTKVYEPVGRVFAMTSIPAVRGSLKVKEDEALEKIKALEEQKALFSNSLKDAEAKLRALLSFKLFQRRKFQYVMSEYPEAEVNQLLDMGFSLELVKFSLNANSRNVNDAVEWLLVHGEDAERSMLESMSTGNASAEEENKPAESEEKGVDDEGKSLAKSLKCLDCNTLFSNVDEAEIHASKTKHVNFSESTEEKKHLTEEEKKDRILKLQERLKLRRLEREQQEKDAAIMKEKNRIKTGKEIAEMRRKHEEQEMKKIAEERRREKLEEKQARQRVLEQIAKDRAEKAQKLDNVIPKMPSTPEPAAGTSSSEGKKSYDKTTLQLRLPNGSTLTGTFGAKETLASVRLFVANSTGNFRDPTKIGLMTNFPKRVFSSEDSDAPLYSLDLVPSAVLYVKFLEISVDAGI
ncbi:unnamed protein product [Notodromas monacha]|uniref:Inorganic pyrophosphatase n=1 Tax=Notodromas monacha TaxID=399045 RepID=A0A7R9BCW2_9CRUS|nr:unnamed protein product [Notodromas monacha]CAG0913021.1 unnamed protein product [Notodromas monacha]